MEDLICFLNRLFSVIPWRARLDDLSVLLFCVDLISATSVLGGGVGLERSSTLALEVVRTVRLGLCFSSCLECLKAGSLDHLIV